MTAFDEAATILQGVEVSSVQWSPSIYSNGGIVTTRTCAGFTTVCDRLSMPTRKREMRTLPGMSTEPIPEYFAEHHLMLVKHVCFPHMECHQTPDLMQQNDQFGGAA